MDIPGGLNGYMAVVRFTMDDIPIVFTASAAAAYAALSTLDADGLDVARKAIDSDASMLCCGAVCTFKNGRVVGFHTGIGLPKLDVETASPAG